MATDEHVETLIIGGGQAGLAVGYHLKSGSATSSSSTRTNASATRGASAGLPCGCIRLRWQPVFRACRFPAPRSLVSDRLASWPTTSSRTPSGSSCLSGAGDYG